MKRPRKKPVDPRIAKQLERKAQALEAWDRAYARLRRAMRAMEKARQEAKAADRAIARREEELAQAEGMVVA